MLSGSTRSSLKKPVVDILDEAHSYNYSALSKMTRKKNSPQKKESETVLSATELQIWIAIRVRKPIQKHNYKATGGSRKKHKGIKTLHDCRI